MAVLGTFLQQQEYTKIFTFQHFSNYDPLLIDNYNNKISLFQPKTKPPFIAKHIKVLCFVIISSQVLCFVIKIITHSCSE